MNGRWIANLAAIAVMLPAVGEASQGPGTGAGTASPWLQLAMAIVVYGGAGLLIAAAAIGAMRQAR